MSWARRKLAGSRLSITLLVVAFLAIGVIYSVITPVFEAPDESEHFSYIVNLALKQGLPTQPPAGPGGLWKQEGSQPPLYYGLAALLIAPVDVSDISALRWDNIHANLGNPLYPADKNRIVHTAAENWPYRNTVLAIHLARWLSLLLGACTVYLIYRIVLGFWPDRRDQALATAALTAFTPQFLFISSAVSNDNLITLLSTLTAWLVIAFFIPKTHHLSVTGREPSAVSLIWRKDGIRCGGLGLVLGLAALTKLSGLVLWPLVGLILSVAAFRRRPLRSAIAELGLVFGVAIAVAGWWYVRNWQLYGDPTGLGAMLAIVGRRERPPSLSDLAYQFEGLRISYWALFGWFNLPVPAWIYRVLDGFSIVALLGLGWGWQVRRRTDRHDWHWRRLLLPLAWSTAFLVSLVRWTMLTPGTQGRLLFPAAWAISLILMAGWSGWASGPWRRAWLAVPIIPLAILSSIVPFAVIRPAYARPALIAADAVPPAARLTPVKQLHGSVTCIGGSVEPASARPGDIVWVTAYWQVSKPLDKDYSVFVHLLDQQGHSVAAQNGWPGLGNYPTRLWQAGAVVVDRHPVQIPVSAPAPMLVRADVGLFLAGGDKTPDVTRGDGNGANLLGTLRLLPLRTEPPQPAHPLSISLNNVITLRGYDLTPVNPLTPGQSLTLTLYWQAQTSMTEDYHVFVHLIGPDGRPVAQGDKAPLDGNWPTSAWEPGQLIRDDYAINLPASLDPGNYPLDVGMYRLSDNWRLPVQTASTERVKDSAIVLEQIGIK